MLTGGVVPLQQVCEVIKTTHLREMYAILAELSRGGSRQPLPVCTSKAQRREAKSRQRGGLHFSWSCKLKGGAGGQVVILRM